MNVALPALIVFFLLVPGFIARSQVQKIESEVLDYSPFGAVVAQALVWAFLLHALWLTGMHLWTSREFAPEHLLGMMSASSSLQSDSVRSVAGQWKEIALYFGSMVAFAYIGPMVVRTIIVRCKLDREGRWCSSLCRFNRAPWYYLLTGADLRDDQKADAIMISAVVSVGGTAHLYVGYLEKWHVDRDGKLDRLVISKTMRRAFSSDKPAEGEADAMGRFYRVDGDFFVLRYDQISTLNVSYRELPAPAELDLLTLSAQIEEIERMVGEDDSAVVRN
ncbi:TPA: hypothetical protein UMV35_000113 [Stenotrophomonas maltophilia]|uniref:hypothetical protein n=1 Tax=Stenotrophomonas TaxID=40323 RepID=UPI0013D991C5|nr:MULTISPECIES: hypothetical protein [Stenotrophomonas]MBH1591844.1 hypothetical protein [Stenotrophomonas maltophilia]MDH2021185.1 hypothetical protein [Stenotrophomonas sp. GD03680]HEL3747880.1 hypothetical protein [Stenotrophomonas maltophilia]HEL7728834.1 hypothetical protein [Stenotrophomonas maltophilia]